MNISRKKHYGIYSPHGFIYPDGLYTSKAEAVRSAKRGGGNDGVVELRVVRTVWPTKRKASKKA